MTESKISTKVKPPTKKELKQIEQESLFDQIIISISIEGESLRKALKDRMRATAFYDMLKEDKQKEERYARACEDRAELMADEILSISDNVGRDLIKLPDGREVVDNAVIQRDRLRVDSRKWLLSKLQPKKYGDKIDVAHSGGVTLKFDTDDGSL